MSKGAALKRSPTATTSAGATNRNTAFGSTNRRINQGQAIRSIFGRARVTQTVRPWASRAGSFDAGTKGSLAAFQPSKPPSSASALTLTCLTLRQVSVRAEALEGCFDGAKDAQ